MTVQNGNGHLKSDPNLTDTNQNEKYPPLTQIKQAIPAHCFQPIVFRSLYYAAKDVIIVFLLYAASHWMWSVFPTSIATILTPVYWLVQGTYFWAIFVVGHDCGHESFSSSSALNDIVGTVMHTFVFAPYYCWKLSHRHHHKNTGNIDKDEVFYPSRESSSRSHYLPGFGLGLAWFIYLACGYHTRPVYHFNPFDVLFKRHVLACASSIGCLVLWSIILYSLADAYGICNFVYHYAIPLLISTSYLVIVTFLHHNEVEVPWYSDRKWDYVKGQISSVDRHYGWCHDLTHNIGTHQIHHLFPKIPHYHLEEATYHFRKTFPDLVHICNEPILPSFLRMFNTFSRQHVIGKHVDFHIYHR